MSEFNLSKKAIRDLSNNPIPNYYFEYDVREFIRILREELDGFISLETKTSCSFATDIVDKYAGENFK